MILGKLDHLVRDVLCDGVALQAFGAALPAIVAFLDAAERRLGDGSDEVVDGEIADLDFAGKAIGVSSMIAGFM